MKYLCATDVKSFFVTSLVMLCCGIRVGLQESSENGLRGTKAYLKLVFQVSILSQLWWRTRKLSLLLLPMM